MKLNTKIFVISKYMEITEEEVDEEFIQKEFLLEDWDEFESLDNEEFFEEIIDIDSFIELVENHLNKEKEINTYEVLKNKVKYNLYIKIIYPIKGILLKIIESYLIKKYDITELPFCLETIPINKWGEECELTWLIENDISLDEIEEM